MAVGNILFSIPALIDAVMDRRRELCAFSPTHKPGFKASSCPEQ